MRKGDNPSVIQQPKARAGRRLFLAVVCSVWVHAATAQGMPEKGFKIMTTMGAGNCLACHMLPSQTGLKIGVSSNLGPPLGQVGGRYTIEQLRQWVTDGREIKPNTLMPPFGTTAGTTFPNQAKPILNAEEIAHVVAALQTLR